MIPGVSSSELMVFVGGFGGLATELELRDAFGDVGIRIARIEVIVSAATGSSRGFAFVGVSRLGTEPLLGTGDEALLERMRGAVVRGRPLTVHRVPSGVGRRTSQ
jgi:RNA recognition motif. (a.k.a. RRM, RBD, or RNP domain)